MSPQNGSEWLKVFLSTFSKIPSYSKWLSHLQLGSTNEDAKFGLTVSLHGKTCCHFRVTSLHCWMVGNQLPELAQPSTHWLHGSPTVLKSYWVHNYIEIHILLFIHERHWQGPTNSTYSAYAMGRCSCTNVTSFFCWCGDRIDIAATLMVANFLRNVEIRNTFSTNLILGTYTCRNHHDWTAFARANLRI